MGYSYGGFCNPIVAKATGFTSENAAKETATQELLRRFPKPSASDPQSVHDELRELRAMVEARFREPSLF